MDRGQGTTPQWPIGHDPCLVEHRNRPEVTRHGACNPRTGMKERFLLGAIVFHVIYAAACAWVGGRW